MPLCRCAFATTPKSTSDLILVTLQTLSMGQMRRRRRRRGRSIHRHTHTHTLNPQRNRLGDTFNRKKSRKYVRVHNPVIRCSGSQSIRLTGKAHQKQSYRIGSQSNRGPRNGLLSLHIYPHYISHHQIPQTGNHSRLGTTFYFLMCVFLFLFMCKTKKKKKKD